MGTQFAHVSIACKDMATIEDFYSKHFGFRRARLIPLGDDISGIGGPVRVRGPARRDGVLSRRQARLPGDLIGLGIGLVIAALVSSDPMRK